MNIRLASAGLALAAGLLPLFALAATPASGTLTDVSGPLAYSAGPFAVANATPVPEVDSGPECDNPAQPCDDYALTVTLPAGYAAAHPLVSVKVTMSWTDSGSGKSDYDLYVYQGTVTNTDGSQQAYTQSASGNDPEIATFMGVPDGTSTYTVKVVPYTPSGETVNVTIELLPGGAIALGPFGGADATVAGQARYGNFYAPHGSSAESSQGEFNIGYNPATGRIMTMNTGPIWRITPAEVVDASTPESCGELWEDKSAIATDTGLDPILWTDQKTGRTFASNSTGGANAAYAYSDNDGDLWVPIGVGPPDGGADHETIGSGPFPALLAPALTTPVNQGENVIYCSQDVVGPAMCQRSVDLGSTWGPGVPAYTGSGTEQCGGLHGHVHIAADGTVWLPVNQCGGHQGGVTSTDAGTTFSEFALNQSHSQAEGADPSIALDADSTAYYCYVNNEPVADGQPPEGHVHIAVSTDGGATWIRDTDVGITHGIVNAAEVEAVGGSSGRAACGFLGTDYPGDYQALSFPGKWYAFIATTYDQGRTWTTVNATPDDPVQSRTGIWQQGGGAEDRNLLDFNEITLDAQGRVLYGYSDGCVSPGCINGSALNDYVGFMRVAHQTGGKSLLAQFDADEPLAPQRACLAGTRDPLAAHLSWKAPDNGGADISNYFVFRGTASGNETLIGQSKGATGFDDTTADPNVPDYYYTVKAVNAAGEGVASNEIKLDVVVPPAPESVCSIPGKTLLSDPAGDATVSPSPAPAGPGTDLQSLQLAQPLAVDGDIVLTFTLHTDSGQSPQPAGSAWYVAMRIDDPAPATTYHYRAVHMAWTGATPTFESYTPGANSNGDVDGRFVEAGTTKPADGSYDAPYDTVVLSVHASDLGLSPGDLISGFVAGSAQTTDPLNVGAGATEVYDGMPNSLSFETTYTVGNSFDCDVIFRQGFE